MRLFLILFFSLSLHATIVYQSDVDQDSIDVTVTEKVDLGDQPETKEPDTEHKINDLLNPFDQLLNHFKGYKAPDLVGQCPTFTLPIDMVSKTYTMTSHCELLKEHESTIASISFVLWSWLVFVIIMGA